MRGKTAPVPVHVLLSHRAWVGRVARALVAGDGAAEDLQQEVWLKALRSGPRHAGAIRAWLRTILRRTARDRWRTEARRRARERAATRTESAPATDDLAQHAETLRKVVDAVVALDEPYRSTVLLRFWEDLPPREVAARQGVSVEAVRSRTRRALGMLRASFSAQHGGGKDWIEAVVPLTGVRASALVASGHAVAAGGVAVGTKAALGGIMAGALMGALAGVVATSQGGQDAPSAEVAALREELSALRGQLQAQAVASPGPALLTAARQEEAPATPDYGERIEALELELQRTRAELAIQAASRFVPRVKQGGPPGESAPFEELDTAELLAEVRRMASKRSPPIDSAGIVAATDVLLGRGLDGDQRAETFILRGIGLRGTHDAAAVRAAFNQARALAGPESDRGREARVQLAWTDADDGRPLESAAGFLEVADHPSSSAGQRAWNRYYAAGQFEKAGKTDRARSEYQRILDDYGETRNPSAQQVVEMARSALVRLKAN